MTPFPLFDVQLFFKFRMTTDITDHGLQSDFYTIYAREFEILVNYNREPVGTASSLIYACMRGRRPDKYLLPA